MSHTDIETFFSEYVFGFIASDIRREIDTAKSGRPGANLLCTLGLLCQRASTDLQDASMRYGP